MTAPRVRPRFELELADDPDRVMEKLRERLPECPNCTGVSVGRHAESSCPRTSRGSGRRGSASPPNRRRTVARGCGADLRPTPTSGPSTCSSPSASGFSLLVGVTWGYAQWAMDQTPWALLSLPLGIVLGGALYLVSLAGQRSAPIRSSTSRMRWWSFSNCEFHPSAYQTMCDGAMSFKIHN